MKSLKATARRGALITVAAASALALASCSAGQITQTSHQVAAVDGASGSTDDGKLVVRDVTVHVTEDGETGLKFTAANLDESNKTHSLKSVKIDGEEVAIDGDTSLKANCSIVADIPSEMDKLTEPKNMCIHHVTTSIDNPGFAFSGNKEVTFSFDGGDVTVLATISAPVHDAGTVDRKVD